MGDLPSGIVTFLFTDIEGSTKLWQEHRDAMPATLVRHNTTILAAVKSYGGVVFRWVGDGACAVFPSASQAVQAAIEIQRALQMDQLPDVPVLRVRMGLHTGPATIVGGEYQGHTLNRVARIMDAAHGGQALVSAATVELAREELPEDIRLRDLGEHHLKDLVRPEHLFQAVAPGLPEEFPALRTLDTHLTNLPVQPTPFLGRQREVEAVEALVRREDVRLLTLTGLGGTGKTRLALEVAGNLLDAFDGVYFVALGTIADSRLVPSLLAEALEVRESSTQSALDAVKAYCRGKKLLLVLDNFEHLLDAARLVTEILAACPRVTALVTSRAVLRVSGEWEYPVSTLSMPSPDEASGLHRIDPDALLAHDAVALFVERARAARPDFALTPENAGTIAEICRRLDGLPLAIELAAARIRLFPPQTLLQRLDNRLRLLTGGARDAPARQQTLRGALDWSYDLLDEDERAVFRRLAVFSGGCTLEAAEAVCAPLNADHGIAELQSDVVDAMASLVEKTLLRQEEGADGEPRFSLLQTVRDYALEMLESCGEGEAIRRQHMQYFVRIAEDVQPGTIGLELSLWMDRIDVELDNLRAALGCSADMGEADICLRIVGSLAWYYWYVRSYWREGRAWADRALQLPGAERRGPARAYALYGAGQLAALLSDYAAARSDLQEALDIVREMEPTAARWPLMVLGWVSTTEGDIPQARTYMERSKELSREVGDRWAIAATLHALGSLAMYEGNYQTAREQIEESIRMLRELGNSDTVAFELNTLGDLARLEGSPEQAAAYYQESLDLFREQRNKGGEASILHNLGYVALASDDQSRGADYFLQGLALFRNLGDQRGIAECLIGLATVLARATQPESAARLLGAAAAMLDKIGAQVSPNNEAEYQQSVTAVRAQVGDERFDEERSRGRDMSESEAAEAAENWVAAITVG